MEFVIEAIRQHREKQKNNHDASGTTEVIVEGCQVKLRFASVGDSGALSAAQSTLISSYLDSVARAGGECA